MTLARTAPSRRLKTGVLLLVAAAGALVVLTSSALAAAPRWHIQSSSETRVAPGGTLTQYLILRNIGDAPTDGSAYSITITLPPGLSGVRASSMAACPAVAGETVIVCTGNTTLAPIHAFTLDVTSAVDLAASGVRTVKVEVSGGGAAPVSTADPVTVAPGAVGFGIDAFDGEVVANAEGDPLTQAGGHAYAASTSIEFNNGPPPSSLANQQSVAGGGRQEHPRRAPTGVRWQSYRRHALHDPGAFKWRGGGRRETTVCADIAGGNGERADHWVGICCRAGLQPRSAAWRARAVRSEHRGHRRGSRC